MNNLTQFSNLTRLTYLQSTQLSSFTERLSLDRLKSDVSSIQSSFGNIRPPQEFFDIKRISKPANFGEVQSRISYNLKHFQTNYFLIVAALSIYSLLTNLLLLFVIVFVGLGLLGINKLQGQDLELGVARFTTSQLYTGLLVVAVPLGIVASPLSTVLWLIGASSVSILGHASFLEKPVETAFEEV
ncbi:hypothetical protein WICPIJ_001555 [Wickerhamomyces pijperi]|uniref:PRA1 family protein n=1 Tax=Wickerhamomyces pijperi TaxID=599730 RepID=A0A9P8QDB2_WICPI|nr:hypothetical protein WICPIJ_001555 [Wickerhamomyces pijperi]